MTHRLLSFTFGLLLICLMAGAQTRYAYLPTKTYFETSQEKILVCYKSAGAASKQIPALQNRLTGKKMVTDRLSILSLESKRKNADTIKNLLSSLQEDTSVLYATRIVIYEDGMNQGITNKILIQPKAGIQIEELGGLFKKWGIQTVTKRIFTESEYIITVNAPDGMDPLDVSNALYETGKFNYCEPDFLRLNAIQTNDTYYNWQWAINNTGSVNQGAGTVGADLHMDEAWQLTTGNQNVRVAIIDNGVDLTHPDLIANLVAGYDALGLGSAGGCDPFDWHGSACSGVVAAVANNSAGTSGIAQHCSIVPVRAGTGNTISTSAAADGINWAVSSSGGHADIISCSWGGGSASSAVNNAIDNATMNGRQGAGSLVLFATGNSNTAVSWPATQANTIAVGASTMCDTRKRSGTDPAGVSCDGETTWGSNYGSGLDVIAPGVLIPTTDVHGSTGGEGTPGLVLFSSDYIRNFGGTSAACPHAAGVMALILSVNPNQTASLTRQILETTVDKVAGYSYATTAGQPNGTWNNQVGYGRINAHKAVCEAFRRLAINGTDVLCNSSQVFTMNNSVSNVAWSLSGGSSSIATVTTNANGSATVSRVGSGNGNVSLIASPVGCPTTSRVLRTIGVGAAPPRSLSATFDAISWVQPLIEIDQITLSPGQTVSQYNWFVEGTSAGSTTNGQGAKIGIGGRNYCNYDYFFLGLSLNTGCGTSPQTTITVNSSNDGCAAFTFTMSPNPASTNVSINIVNNKTNAKSVNTNTQYDVIVYDQAQNIVSRQKLAAGTTKHSLNTSNLRTGLYFVQLTDQKESHTLPLSITNN